MRRRALLAAAALPLVARAAAWPDRPIRLVVPFAAGTTTDILARLCGSALAQGLGQPVVPDNRAGAGGTVGTLAVAQAAPDGNTLLFGTSGTMATNPVIMRAIPYDPLRDFAPVAAYARTSVILGVRPQLGVRSLSEFLALARRQPLSVGTAGTGTTGHLTTALIALRSGVALTHVPYRDGSRAIADLLNGTLDAMVYHPLGFLPHIQSGAILPLAVTGESRHALFPAVPTLAEGGLADAVVEGWWALYAPAGTPGPVLARLNRLVNDSLAQAETRAELARQGLEVMGGTPDWLADHTRTELARQREVAQAANITAD
ncbi:Bug family tripartite tricarboxylate transporter substrate binding protein [Paracraurococcus lichenis]|uniref:Tripartite tricarboxylate transporter substrate binding protein n=1 Tax=Paracraurococcus lichenis TaxID=3064888 RepID=A0ABT9DSK8_9PROT|nr:tripartite tricarboxylate transporter substrate binding protein [Paracraurococcus sp. LOR1-02]MDO9706884.1 tripartite tricarboxylate transporter substrate binding protein [Paracraurococcus sp. LOR1-02]